eukprot:10844449-Ditylum_brightwellii.AAC.1
MQNRGLIGACHNNYRDDLGSVASQVFSPSAIWGNPIISKGQDSKKKGRNSKTTHAKTSKEKEDEGVCVIKRKDNDNDSSLYGDLCEALHLQAPAISVSCAGKGKKVLVDGMLVHEASMVLKQLSRKLA